jgi:hypothetical protein
MKCRRCHLGKLSKLSFVQRGEFVRDSAPVNCLDAISSINEEDGLHARGRMQPRVERKAFLFYWFIETLSRGWIEDNIPTVVGDYAWDKDERSRLQQSITERLLTSADGTGPKPIRIWHIRRFDDMHMRRVSDPRPSQNMRNDIKRLERCVNCHLQDGGSGVHRRIYGTNSARTPASACKVATLTTIPSEPVFLLIQSPEDERAGPEGRGEWRHV